AVPAKSPGSKKRRIVEARLPRYERNGKRPRRVVPTWQASAPGDGAFRFDRAAAARLPGNWRPLRQSFLAIDTPGPTASASRHSVERRGPRVADWRLPHHRAPSWTRLPPDWHETSKSRGG